MAVLSGSYIVHREILDGINHAGLIISPNDADITSSCVSFNAASITGFELLDRSETVYAIQDGFINSIMDITNPQGGTMYWSYWRWNGREWTFNNTGTANSVVYPGSIEAWLFTSWEVFPSLPPNYIPNLNQICNQIVLKNYSDQPYLNYWDLNPTSVLLMDEHSELDESIQDEPVEESGRSILPLIIIGVVGVIVLIIILTVLIKKK